MAFPALNISVLSLPLKAKRVLKRAFIAGSAAAYLGGMGVLGLFAMAAKDLPDPASLWERSRPVSIQIVDRNGREILVRGAAVEQPVNLDVLPFHVPMTVLATEDKRYYNHIGVDPLGIARAMMVNIKACLLYTSPSPRDGLLSRMPSSA